MVDFRIQPEDVIRPTSVTLVRRDPLPATAALSARARIERFIEAVSLVADTKTNPDKFRVDATRSQRHVDATMFSQVRVPRGNVITDHSVRRPTVIQFEGVVTETPIFDLTNPVPGQLPGVSRVQSQLRILRQFYRDREPLFVASSIQTIDGMAIRSMSIGKRQGTGVAVDVSITLQEILFLEEVRSEAIPETLIAQLGGGETRVSTSAVGGG